MVGVIVLAAYRPSKELFARQLASIRDQTVTDWECIISVDGELETVEEVVADVAAGDDRFRILADGRRLGFYLNFERGLEAVPAEAEWVALSDQDDFWYPDKLETLLPHLSESAIVSGQARLVAHPGDEVLGFTERRQLDAASTMIVNQFTGSLCIFRGDLLSTALPFPRLSSHTVAHDHWLAVVGMAQGGGLIVEDVVQDYVQHSANVFGDPSRLRLGPIATLRRAWANAVGFAARYEGTASPPAMARMLFWIYAGWRQLMAQTLVERDPLSPSAIEMDRRFGSGRRLRETVGMLRRVRRARVVPMPFVIAYLASWASGWLVRGRRRKPTVAP
ncbi:glycosyltransferase [Microbacterium sp. NPDC088619]|uniref:glycosyltransferase n=1 Tax=Microbacterium sp. NPDC088619 TaxID=3364196 RepID=UPI00382E58F8